MKTVLNRLFNHEILSRKESKEILLNITHGLYNEAQIAALLTVYKMRSVSVEELIGFREALLESRIRIDLSEFSPIDIVGTGGDGKNTFNISTCACFVVAGAGYKVAKHGNYGATSVSGASNVIEQHGVKFTNDERAMQHRLSARTAFQSGHENRCSHTKIITSQHNIQPARASCQSGIAS